MLRVAIPILFAIAITAFISIPFSLGYHPGENEIPEPSGSEWDHTFSEQNGKTKVNISIYNESLERMERILDGFTQGMKLSLTNLENLLAVLSGK